MNAYGAKAQHGMPVRPGMTVPLPGHLNTHRDRLIELADMGYTDIWSAEADGADAFTPLALASAWDPRLRLGTAIVPAYTRSPACFAQSVATLADAAPGRFAIGVGSSSNVIVQKWNGIPFDEPYKKVRDVVRFLNDALSGEKVTKEYDTFKVDGFRLGIRPEVKPQILVAALREGMLRLAAREADGAIINWLSAEDVTRVAEVVRGAAEGTPKEIVAKINEALRVSLAQPEVEKRLAVIDGVVAVSSPAEFETFLKKEIATWSKLLKPSDSNKEKK
jgi:probable F420-dependent oxidoreductase